MKKIIRWIKERLGKMARCDLEQASKKGVYVGKDISLSQKKLIELLSADLKTELTKENGWLKYQNLKISIKNITYLGNPHPLHKKRVQFSVSLIDSYIKNPSDKIIMGHYINSFDERVYVVWILKNKDKVGLSKSSHVLVSDLLTTIQLGLKNRKIDRFGNEVVILHPSDIKDYIDGLNSEEPDQNQLLKNFAVNILTYDSNWDGKGRVLEMQKNNFKHWKQTEWPGFYLEYKAKKYFATNKKVLVPSKNRYGRFEPDMFIDTDVDLKYHSNTDNFILANDAEGMLQSIENCGKIVYLVAVGNSVKDDDFEFTIWFKNLRQGPEAGEINKDKTRVLKKSVKIEEFYLIEINKEVFSRLDDFQKGMLNSNGSPRNAKKKINHKKVKKTVIK